MADYIYTMESRLTPDQMRGVSLVQDVARAHDMNVYLTGGAIRDLLTGFLIRDLDFTVQGNPLKLQKDLERAGASVISADEDFKILHITLPGGVRAEISMARTETFEKPGRPVIASATINEDLRRRDFTVNAMALSLNPGSRGLLLDPSNGAADVEARLIRILHNYSFLDDPSRLVRATRFATRFDWPLEERTQSRYDAAKENGYIEHIGSRTVGHEIEQLSLEEDPVKTLKALEKEGWLTVLHEKWATAKMELGCLTQICKIRQQMLEFNLVPDTAPVVLHFLTRKFSDNEVAAIRRILPRKDIVAAWKHLEDDAKELSHKLVGKETAQPSQAWKLLSSTRPELMMFILIAGKQEAAKAKIGNFLGKWQQVRTKLPFPEMAELRITPALPEYGKVMDEAFLLLLDGKLKSHTEVMKFLKPYEPPPPPPPPPVRRGRAAKAVEAAPAAPPAPKAEETATAAAKGPAKAAKAAKGKKNEAPAAEPLAAVASAAGSVAGKIVKAAKSVAAVAKKAAEVPRKSAASPEAKRPEAKKAAPPVKAAKPAAKPEKSGKVAKPAPKSTSKPAAKPAAKKVAAKAGKRK